MSTLDLCEQSEDVFLFSFEYKRKDMTLQNAEWYGLYRGSLYRNGKCGH